MESFIRSFRGIDIHVLIPQEQKALYFFSAYALLIRNSPESRTMVEDWFLLKDECPYAKFHDQQRLYIALLHMVLNYEGEEVNHNVKSQTDCMPHCVSDQSAKYMSFCFGALSYKIQQFVTVSLAYLSLHSIQNLQFVMCYQHAAAAALAS